MSNDPNSGLDQSRAHFDELRLELASETKDWRRPLVVHTYDPDEDGQEDYEDDAMIFAEHGYARSSVLRWAGNPKEWALTGTFSKDADEAELGPAIIVRTYTGKQQADASVAFVEDAADLALDGYKAGSAELGRGPLWVWRVLGCPRAVHCCAWLADLHLHAAGEAGWHAYGDV